MKNCFAALAFTANLLAIQSLIPIQSVQAQSAKMLQPLNEASLLESSEGLYEVPGIGGSSDENSTTEVLESDSVSSNEQTSEATPNAADTIFRPQQTNTCQNRNFVLLQWCWSF